MAIRNTAQIPTLCGTCLYFPLKEALEAGGHGYCRRMEKARRYDWPATVLYSPHMDMLARENMIRKFEEVQQRKEDDATK